MTLSPLRKHKIYLAATMRYALGSENPEEVAYYLKIKEEMRQDRLERNIVISRTD